MNVMTKAYFTKVFIDSESNAVHEQNLEQRIIREVQNGKLVVDLSFYEFTIALKQMHHDKASGHDSFNPHFFQHFWE